jgi:hypothetical protein
MEIDQEQPARRTEEDLLVSPEPVRRFAVASDAHAPTLRQIGMTAAAHALGNDELGRWLTEEVPAAIAEGRDLPPRPARPPRRFRRPS